MEEGRGRARSPSAPLRAEGREGKREERREKKILRSE
jgi:hypothetical protein